MNSRSNLFVLSNPYRCLQFEHTFKEIPFVKNFGMYSLNYTRTFHSTPVLYRSLSIS
ncbi:hypothetical protein LEP1GSC073_1774 [Leptospira noguchii str. Cascata]|nr:hypothetical protein LEP1GSC073_1774 [Leptospira noguchii str. Cascata]